MPIGAIVCRSFLATLCVMDSSPEGDLRRFAEIVKARREELDLRQDQLKERGGPSTTTMTMVENAQGSPSGVTLRKLDTGLGWEPGSARAALDGGDPKPLIAGADGAPAAPPARHWLDDISTEEIIEEIRVLFAEVRRRIPRADGVVNKSQHWSEGFRERFRDQLPPVGRGEDGDHADELGGG